MDKPTIKIRLRTWPKDQFRSCEVGLDGRIDEFPYDVRVTIVHPEDKHLLKRLELPRKFHKT